MEDGVFAKLEFARVREALAGHCASALGKRLAETLEPSTKVARVREWLDQVRELLAVAEDYGLPPMGGVYDVRADIRATGKPQPLEAETLARVAETLDATANVRAWLALVGEKAPSLARLGERIGDFAELAAGINESIDPRGKVRDSASVKLMSVRQAITRARAQIRVVFDRILGRSSYTKLLQYAGATFHEDRTVLPLKAEYRGRIPGIVHRVSDSGATLFVEPAESVELNNTVVQLREAEQKEITRILRELTQRLQGRAPEILDALRALAVLDLVAGKCRYAKKRRCVCSEIDEEGVLRLYEARHPVLLELFDEQAEAAGPARKVVPIDVRLGEDFDILVVTGPNTGGKTVAIKTIGLLALMAQAGIPIPAGAGSRVPVYRHVFVDVGDEQSLQQSLSTFSSHLSNVLHMLKHASPRSLVLIDELGAGTDPDEGAAIGSAVVEELLRLKAKAVVTTHLSELKALAFTLPRVDNGAVEFDVESLQPTYHLRLGEPGNSNALVIAERLGMAARLVGRARTHLAGRHRMLQEAIDGTLESRRRAEAARRAARDAEVAAERRSVEAEQEREDLERAKAEFARWTKWIHDLAPGDSVYLKSMRCPARVVRMQLQRQTALVFTGTLDVEVPLRDLQTPGGDA
ncbi:MAG TPA: DNA strand exchange inhibitor protein [Phycisphaerae bacterium]|nr:DNA strand exchange inhibitor protein [Phycisphaerae bacterium]HNU44483.1 DNA strand exchange inhibitor protein [Phycisphaerae bacterium]